MPAQWDYIVGMKLLDRIRRYGPLLVLTSASLLAQVSNRIGVIDGLVLNGADEPVADAKVKANFTGGFSGMVPSGITDKSGHFVIRGLSLGEWYVTASKEVDGYPDESNAFYVGFSSTPVTIALDARHREQTITVHLGRKAGTIFGTIVDAETGKPVEPCAELQWKHAPSISWSGYGLLKSKFRLLVPADTDITLAIWLWGYEPWFYEAEKGSDVLRVHASNQLELQVRLIPDKVKTRQPNEEELKEMNDSISANGCGTPAPRR
jgi:hypothetical protein